jgi:deoxycytidylate deaminase
MKILVDKALRILKKMPKIIKSITKTENDEKNSIFNLGRNPLEIVHGPLFIYLFPCSMCTQDMS